jgi:predicted O-methyltransferase YrrM
MGYFKEPAHNLIRWLHSSNETTNFTYDLEEANKQYLASLLAVVLSISYDQAISYIREIEEDEELKNHIARATAQSEWSFRADPEVRLGRRMGWYVIARVLKPKVIVETGVDKGLGACVLTAALKRNKEESFDGRYYGTDIDSRAGYLLSGQYARFGSILFGDSIDSLKKLEGPIDLFINDSDHSTDYEANEYEIISDKLSRHAIVLGDNSHCSDKLLSFSFKHNRNFVFFQEKPRNHWYPGGGIGISFLR